jgi:5'-3' exonuclease
MAKSFSSLNEGEQGTVLVVDSLNLAFRFKHQKALFFLKEYVATVESLKKSYRATQVIILSDWGKSSYRREIYPEYKYNREAAREEQTPEDAAYFEKFFEEYLKIIDFYKSETSYPVFRFQGVEADDIAAHIVANRELYNFKKLWLISSDRDWDLLCNEQTSRFSYVTRKEITFDNYHEHYDWTPEEYISIKCLQGDAGDNVPGALKIGPKTALKLVREYGSALDIADALPLPGKYVYIKNLNDFGAAALHRNYQLMDLLAFSDDAIGLDNIKTIKETLCHQTV